MPARASLYVVPDDPDPTNEPSERAMPVDLDAERAVLGAAMLSATTLAEMRTVIDGSDFYRPAHETIWQAACALADAGRSTDAVALASALGPDLARVGGAPYLHACMGSVPTAANGPYHAEILRQKSYARLGRPGPTAHGVRRAALPAQRAALVDPRQGRRRLARDADPRRFRRHARARRPRHRGGGQGTRQRPTRNRMVRADQPLPGRRPAARRTQVPVFNSMAAPLVSHHPPPGKRAVAAFVCPQSTASHARDAALCFSRKECPMTPLRS